MLGSLQLLFRQLEFQFASSLIVVIWKVIDWIEARQSDGKHDVLLLAGRDSVFAQTTAVPGNMPGLNGTVEHKSLRDNKLERSVDRDSSLLRRADCYAVCIRRSNASATFKRTLSDTQVT